MTEAKKSPSDILDEMALKILIVEPGDLSVVGELLDLVEQLQRDGNSNGSTVLEQMAGVFREVIEKIVMADLPDTAENFDRLGKCITQMQETVRKEGQADAAIIQQFCDSVKETGFELDLRRFCLTESAGEKEAAPETIQEEMCEEDTSSGSDAESEKVQEVVPPVAGASVPNFLQDRDLLSGFIEEAFEHLESIEVNVLELEQRPDDIEIINNIFRPFHTIKGVSGFLNLKTINTLAHATENLLDDVRNGVRNMNSETIDVVLDVGDSLKLMVENIKDVLDQGPEQYIETDISEYLERIREIQQGEGGATTTEELQTEKPVEDEAGAEPEENTAQPESEPEQETFSGESLAEAMSNQTEAKPKPLSDSQLAAEVSKNKEAAVPTRRVGSSIKVDVEKLDALVNAVGELVIMQSLVRQNPLVASIGDPKLTKDFSQLSRITSELQKTAMSMRMVPIRQTFDKMIRLVRDLSKKTHKQVDLIMEGAETEIDRNMVDSIYDPLVHMMRNSVDHGVKTPEEREKIGKRGTGTVYLRAYQKGGNIVIEIEDDGEGLNTQKIRQKAIERGLIKPGDELSDYELNNLIFLPGFSTADKITDVSGRGVGMDVVKKAVEKLRGKVEAHSQPGKGTQFVMRLPLTLAIIDGILVRVGNERYIIPTVAIQESMRPDPKNYNTVHGKGETLMVRGSLIPIIRLYEIFNVKPNYTDPRDAIVVVVENEGRRRALMVDELLGKEEVVIKSLGGYMKDVKGIAGGTILGDGRVGLILDLAGLIASSEEA